MSTVTATVTDSSGQSASASVAYAVGTAERFPGDPGPGRYLIGWAEPQTATTGESWTGAPPGVSVLHSYSTATNARVQTSKLDTAINSGRIASQSFKLSTWTPAQILAGLADAAIDTSAGDCLARAPHPIWLCYYHEPEDNFPTASAAADYRGAYRRIVDRFRARSVTNVAWMPILQSPWTFRTTAMGRPGGGSNRDWRWWHPDWNGSGWHSDRMMDLLGLDVYNPLVGGTSNQSFGTMLDDTLNRIAADGFGPLPPIVLPEFGMSNVATPTPDWPAWCALARDYALGHGIACFCYWNNNNDSPRRYDFTAASDPSGSKLAGWRTITAAASTYQPALI